MATSKKSDGAFADQWNAALNAIREASTALVRGEEEDAKGGLNAVEAFVAALGDDTGELVTAAAQAASTGGDTGTWLAALDAAVDAAALRTIREEQGLSERTQDRLMALAVGALHTVVMLALAAA